MSSQPTPTARFQLTDSREVYDILSSVFVIPPSPRPDIALARTTLRDCLLDIERLNQLHPQK